MMSNIRRHPKGINILALMASFLDPRMKGGVGFQNWIKKSSMTNKIAHSGHCSCWGKSSTSTGTTTARTCTGSPWTNPTTTCWRWWLIWWDQQSLNVSRAADSEAENPAVNIATMADAELTLHKQEPTLKPKKDDGTFNYPWHSGNTASVQISVNLGI